MLSSKDRIVSALVSSSAMLPAERCHGVTCSTLIQRVSAGRASEPTEYSEGGCLKRSLHLSDLMSAKLLCSRCSRVSTVTP